ncbi:MAG: hypothetical protein SGI91_10215 [Alphaproteobacteria bacterium]|jgi:hypothetical protein|nr:hypothetical protein [Alphaproteobacteria bacterium]
MNNSFGFNRTVLTSAALQPRYAYRVTFAGGVRVTTDPVEVARIRRAYPAAQVQIIPIG